VFTFEASRCASPETPLPKHALVDLAEAALRAFAPIRDSESGTCTSKYDSAHARSCAAHVVRHGALAHLDESGRRALVERLMELLAPGGCARGTHRESRRRRRRRRRRFRRRRDASRRRERRITSRRRAAAFGVGDVAVLGGGAGGVRPRGR